MGASRDASVRLLRVVLDMQQFGPSEALLRYLDLPDLAGRPATEVFVHLLEFVCLPGGSVDEAIVRQAMLDAIGDLAEVGVGAFNTLTPDQLQEFFLDFVARSIEGRVIVDLGVRSITLPQDIALAENAQQQLHEFVIGCTRGALAGRLDGVDRLGDRDLQHVVNKIYEAAFELMATAGEDVA